EGLEWVTATGELLLAERRRVTALPAEGGWLLEVTTTLTNPGDGDVRVGSPATNGRAGAGYGGVFWRLPPSRDPQVRTLAATGEPEVHGSRDPWLAWVDRALGFTLVFTRTEREVPLDPWFVRVAEYPGVGVQVAARDPLTLTAGEGMTRGLR